MVLGLGSGGGKRGGGQGSNDRGKGKRAASKSASPPQQSQRQQTTAGGTSSTQQSRQPDIRMAVGSFIESRTQNTALPAVPARQGTGGSMTAATALSLAPPQAQRTNTGKVFECTS